MNAAFVVPDIECEQCAEAIRLSLGQIDGITAIEIDVEACTVSVDVGEGQVADSTIRAVLEEAGYPTSP